MYLVKGSNVKLDNMKTYKRYSLLKVVNPNKKIIVNPFKENVRNKKADTVLKELHEDTPFVELGKRDRKQNVLMNIGHTKERLFIPARLTNLHSSQGMRRHYLVAF